MVLVLRPEPKRAVSVDGTPEEFNNDNRDRVAKVNESLTKNEEAFMVIARTLVE